MFSPVVLLAAVLGMFGAVFLVAHRAEKAGKAGRKWPHSKLVYALAVSVYCTSWTFYGSVGKASTSGMSFLAVYIGPTLAVLAGQALLVRLVRQKRRHRITSLAGWMAVRYSKSPTVAALSTVVLAVGTAPYLSLQIRSILDTLAVSTDASASSPILDAAVQYLLIVLLIVFTIGYGFRRLDLTERHPGMIASLAFDGILKLAAFCGSGSLRNMGRLRWARRCVDDNVRTPRRQAVLWTDESLAASRLGRVRDAVDVRFRIAAATVSSLGGGSAQHTAHPRCYLEQRVVPHSDQPVRGTDRAGRDASARFVRRPIRARDCGGPRSKASVARDPDGWLLSGDGNDCAGDHDGVDHGHELPGHPYRAEGFGSLRASSCLAHTVGWWLPW